MSKRRYTNMQVLLPIIEKKIEAGMSQREIELELGLEGDRLLFFFAISVILHGIWDCPLRLFGNYGTQIILTVVAWIITLPLISAGLKQITRLARKRSEEPAVSEEV